MIDIAHELENPIAGCPFVVVVVSDARYQVDVFAHCKSFEEAAAIIDEAPDDEHMQTCMIVRDTELVSFLVMHRKRQAVRMEKAFLRAPSA